MSHYVTVYFATGSATWGRVAASWRSPKRCYRALCARIGKAILREPVSHCSVGVDAVVMDKQMSGPGFWPLSKYLKHYPTLSHAYVVPVVTPVDLKLIHPGGPIRPIHTIIKWVTNGRYDSGDCVDLTRTALAMGGINVPRECCTPGRLDRWMSQRAFKRVDLCNSKTRSRTT